jgi:hypothetical protein
MPVYEVNDITIQKGTDFTKTFFGIKNSDGSPLGINSSFIGTSKLRKNPKSKTSYPFNVILNQIDDSITISMASSITSTLPSGRCYFDVLLRTGPLEIATKEPISGTIIVQDTCSL